MLNSGTKRGRAEGTKQPPPGMLPAPTPTTNPHPCLASSLHCHDPLLLLADIRLRKISWVKVQEESTVGRDTGPPVHEQVLRGVVVPNDRIVRRGE